ncbi:molecular chaperone DnaK (HSP70) [Saccharothrix ecbatanensis]|uniref:Molecular chaperone DnaK (HSP70) n=1 Tax=Saccharothrix ecbatanensis TaxID=1105145 RepID=A0A7W9HIU7_9PSEU|nr:Hsp70 family protein [Saccharothrix ecbatanensis]MBB5803104.1 molecular chaperone DnaK (HSP70) [Saccharothrix ecbatanensis]
MRYAVGIDLGTTFASAAVSDAAGTRMVPLSPEMVVPSLAYCAPDGTLLTGTAAADAPADPQRLGRGFKRRLGDPTPLLLGGRAYTPTALMAAQLRAVLDQVTDAMGGPPASIVLTCPAIWGPYRREQFAEVPRLADVTDFQLVTEPEAAATHYSRERALGDGEVVAVYDLGGGTLDTTVLRMRSGGMEILGTPEGLEHLGGMDLDDALFAHLDERLDGAIGRLDPTDPAEASALARIRALCVHTKTELSTEPDVALTVPLPSRPRELTITRPEFDAVIRPSLELTVGALRRTVASAGLRDDELSAVLLAGGSSRVPLVRQLLSEAFDKPVRAAHHPKFTVALGAAALAARALADPQPDHSPDGVDTAPSTEQQPRRPKRLVPMALAALAVAAALVVVLVTTTRTTTTATTTTPTATTTTTPVTTTTEAPPESRSTTPSPVSTKNAPTTTSAPAAAAPSSARSAAPPPPTEKKVYSEPPPKAIKLRNEATNMCVGIRGADAGTPTNNVLRQSRCDEHPDANQKWFYTVPHSKAGPNGSDLLMFSHIHDANDNAWYCFDLPAFGRQPAGTKVVVSACNGNLNDNQQWWLDRDAASGTVRIRNHAADGRCLALERDEAWPEGAPVTIEECADSTSRWFMVETSGP